MILRIDRLQMEMDMPEQPDPAAAAIVQELLGGRFGEMSTFMNYTFQSWNFRGREKVRPYYELIANIGTEEYGHVELVASTVNGMLTGSSSGGDPTDTPLAGVMPPPNPHHFIVQGQTAAVANSLGQPWQGDYVFNSGDLVLDLLHNFFLGVRRADPQDPRLRDDRPPDRPPDAGLPVRARRRACARLRQGARGADRRDGLEAAQHPEHPELGTSRRPRSGRTRPHTARSTASARPTSTTSGRSGRGRTPTTARRSVASRPTSPVRRTVGRSADFPESPGSTSCRV